MASSNVETLIDPIPDLGFRTESDMNANNEPSSPPTSRTTLSDLPSKCLVEIFKSIPLQNLDDIIELSPQWDQLVQENIPVEVHLTDIGFRIALHYFVGFEQLPKYRIKVVHSRVLDETLPDLKSPEDLRVLDFCTQTELSTFSQLVKNASNVQEMYFGYSSLTCAPLGEVDFNMPHLKVLCIADRLVECKQMDAEQMAILPRNILGFLEKTFPSIEKLVLCTTAQRHQTIDYAKQFIKFIQRHSSTLKTVKFLIRSPIFHLVQINGISDCVELSNEDFKPEQLACLQLNDLDVKCGYNFFCGLEQWRAILEHQKKLKYLTFALEKPLDPVIYQAPITNSAPHLKTVEIGIAVFDETKEPAQIPFDCALFENCVMLELLVLSGPLMTQTSLDAGRVPKIELLNLEKLPKQLACFGIDNIYLGTQQISEFICSVTQKERQLQKLSLQNIGTDGEFGVTVSMLDSWIQGKVLREIIINAGMTKDEAVLEDYKHLEQFGVKSPVAQSSVHAFYYPILSEYKRPADVAEQKQPAFTFE